MQPVNNLFPASMRAILEGEPLEALSQQFAEDIIGHCDCCCAWIGAERSANHYAEWAVAGDKKWFSPCKGWMDGSPHDVADLARNALLAGGVSLLRLDDFKDAESRELAASGLDGVLSLTLGLLGKSRVMAVLFFRSGMNAVTDADAMQGFATDLRWVMAQALVHHRRAEVERAVQSCGNSMFLTDEQGDIVWVNNAFTSLTGYRPQDVVGCNPRFLKSGRQGKRYYENLWQTINSGRVWSSETIDRDKDGVQYAIQQTISPITREGRVTHYLSVHEDITRKRELRVDAERAAVKDHLTGLLNQVSFHDSLSARVKAAAADDAVMAVASFTLDSFSAINVLGPDVTSLVLEEVGARISNTLAEGDVAGYLGHGDFGVILASVGSREEATALMDSISKAVDEPYPFLGERLYLSPRAGIAMFPADADNAEDIWAGADDGLTMSQGKGGA